MLGLRPPGLEFRILCLEDSVQFSLYVHKGGLKPDSFHFICDNRRDENVTVLKMVALPLALAYVDALVRFGKITFSNNVFEKHAI